MTPDHIIMLASTRVGSGQGMVSDVLYALLEALQYYDPFPCLACANKNFVIVKFEGEPLSPFEMAIDVRVEESLSPVVDNSPFVARRKCVDGGRVDSPWWQRAH